MFKGIVLICDKNFVITRSVFSSFSDSIAIPENAPFADICDTEEHTKVNLFTDELILKGAAFNWEINVVFKDKLKSLKFSGSKFNDDFFLMGLESNNDVPLLYEELMKINNEQSNIIREIVKEKFLNKTQDDEDIDTYNKLTQLNNELANLQREMAKKNIELKKLNDIKNMFIGMAAHDLRNPLNVILSYSDFLLSETKQLISEEQYDFLHSISSSSEFMLNLVEDLLDYTKIESGKIDLQKESHDLIAFIKTTINRNQVLANQKNITIIFNYNVDEVIMSFDRSKFEQVINNLVGNAVKFSFPNSTVIVELEKEDDTITISIVDSGKGIAAQNIDRIFIPFDRKASTKGTAGEKSTGLGLSITKKIIEAHDGTIGVESELGKGSKFIISLKN